MRRQRTEVVVELRKVSSFGLQIALLSLGTSPQKHVAPVFAHMTFLFRLCRSRTKETSTF